MKIYAPVKDFNGVRNGVRFVEGVGETDDSSLLNWFRTRGYKVPVEDTVKTAELTTPTVTVSDDEVEMMGYTPKVPNFEAMNPNELREWAKANGLGGVIKNTRNREKLLKLIRGE